MTKNNAKPPKIALLFTSQMRKNCIAGAIANNRLRNGCYAIDELERFFKGEKPLYQVNLKHRNFLFGEPERFALHCGKGLRP